MNEPTLSRICFAEMQPLSPSENGMQYASLQFLKLRKVKAAFVSCLKKLTAFPDMSVAT